MEAIILAGGFGTRLKQVVKDVPKPMAPINDTPFLEYILDWLNSHKINHVIIAVGYKKEIIIDYFKDSYKNIQIQYSIEDTPLFTGGAIKKALTKCNDKNIFIINGDTYFNVDLEKMYKFHLEKNSDFTIAVKQMQKFDRYGTVNTKEDKVIGFSEKKYHEEGYINGGIYIFKKNLLNEVEKKAFSLEQEYMEKYYNKINMNAFKSQAYFIDIGIPEDYYRAQSEIQKPRKE